MMRVSEHRSGVDFLSMSTGSAGKPHQMAGGANSCQPRMLAFTLAQYFADVGFIRLA